MKSMFHRRSGVLAAVSALLVMATLAPAQIVHFSGSVTAVSDEFAGVYGLGAPVAVSVNLCPPMLDLAPEDDDIGLFTGRRITLRIDGQSCRVDSWPSEVALIRSGYGPLAGLSVGASWSMDRPHVVVLGLMGDTDRIVSDVAFPEGIPMESFTYREGTYLTPDGKVEWTIDSYRVEAGTAMPEPATYGLAAVSLLVGLVAWNRWRRGPRGVEA